MAGDACRERRVHLIDRVEEHALDDRLLVDGVVERLAHLGIGERRLRVVERDEDRAVARRLEDGDVPARGQRLQVGDRWVHDHVELPRPQPRLAGVGLGNDVEHDLAVVGLVAPVAVVALVGGLAAFLEAHERVRAGAHRVHDVGVGVAILGGRRWRENRRDGHAEVRQHVRVDVLQVEPHCRGVDNVDALDDLECGTDRHLDLRVDEPAEAELHRVGVQRCPVVELHPGAQLEGEREAVARCRPRGREHRLDLAVLVEGDQRLQAIVNDVLHGGRRLLRGIDGVEVDPDADG